MLLSRSRAATSMSSPGVDQYCAFLAALLIHVQWKVGGATCLSIQQCASYGQVCVVIVVAEYYIDNGDEHECAQLYAIQTLLQVDVLGGGVERTEAIQM